MQTCRSWLREMWVPVTLLLLPYARKPYQLWFFHMTAALTAVVAEVTCTCSKNSLKTICSFPYWSNHIFNKLTLTPFQTEWQIHLARDAASIAAVKQLSVCSSSCQPLDTKAYNQISSERSWDAAEGNREIRAQKESWKEHQASRRQPRDKHLLSLFHRWLVLCVIDVCGSL